MEFVEMLYRKFVERTGMTDEVAMKSPWAEYVTLVKALFDRDDDVIIDYDNEEATLTLYVDDAIKADALMEMQTRGIFPAERQYGNVTLRVNVIPANDEVTETDLYAAAFNGNPVFDGIGCIEQTGLVLDYALFAPVAVQYYSDDLSEYGGVTTTTYADVAKRVFDAKGVRISSSHLPEIIF